MRKIFSTSPVWQNEALALLRIITGIFLIYQGREIFNPHRIKEYSQWEVIQKMPFPLFIAYFGKSMELITGIFLAFGFLTRIGSLCMSITMLIIAFRIGTGRFFEQGQHPFLFVLLGMLFFFTGPVKWSVDQKLFKEKISK